MTIFGMIIRKNFLGKAQTVEKKWPATARSLLATKVVKGFPDPVAQVADYKAPMPVPPSVWERRGHLTAPPADARTDFRVDFIVSRREDRPLVFMPS